MSPIEELRALLDERGIEHVDDDDGHTQHTWWSDGDHEISACNSGKRLAVYNLTPEQAIAAMVGTRTDLPKRLREVTGLHAFAELFGFDWTGESDWSWHDVACAMADAVDAATVGKDIEHYDGSGRSGTVAILQGGRKPEEVLFVHDDGGVTHYVPERTAERVSVPRKSHVALGHYECGECHGTVGPQDNYCRSCGTKLLDGLGSEAND